MALKISTFLLNNIYNIPKHIGILFLIIVFLLLPITYSQNINFKHLTIDDGLSQNAVFAILQDSKGFMWFGTKDGLNRYDGYSFRVYQNNPFDTLTISANYITFLFEDSRGILWVGTLDGGLNIYRSETDSFEKIIYKSSLTGKKSRLEISSIAEDAIGNIWIGTKGDGLFRLSIKQNKTLEINYKQFINSPDNPESLNNNIVSNLYLDSKQELWISTLKGLNKFNQRNEEFLQFNIQTQNPKAAPGIFNIGVHGICETKLGDFWIGTLSGLIKLDRKTKAYKLYPHRYAVFRYGWGNITKIVEDTSGKLWLATPGGLMKFDPASFTYDYFNNDPFNPQTMSYNSVSSLCVDKTGILWIGTTGMGINYYDHKATRFSTFITNKDATSRISGFSVRSIVEDDYGYVWVSSDVLFRWNRKTGEVKSFEKSSIELNAFGNTGIWSMIKSTDGNIWAATSEGLYNFDPASDKYRQYKFNSKDSLGLPQKNVSAVFQDIHGSIWVVASNFLCKLIDAQKGIFKNYRYQPTPPYTEPVRVPVYQDKNNIFWLGTKDGLISFDEYANEFNYYQNDPTNSFTLNNNLIKSICPDPKDPENILWIGTAGGGLNRFDKVKKTFTHFTEKDGLPNNVVYGILPDDDEDLWLSTNRGLSRFNPVKKTFRNYDVYDGLQSNEFNTGAYYRGQRGELFFGGIKGLNYFHPKNIIDNPFVPEIVILNVSVSNFSAVISANNLRKQNSKQEEDRLILSHDNDVITFEFTALDFSSPEKNQYAYKLENFNDDWIHSGTIHSATYTNLPPGEYVFRVKGSNNDGKWNEKGASFYFTIKPPWWISWWAYLLYASVFMSGLYVIRRYELNRLKLKNQLRLEKVEMNTLRHLDQMRSNFFANISHEFRTPLTLILGQVESVMSSDLATKEKGKLQVANRNAKRLLTLINQLLDLSKLEAGSMALKAEQQNIVSFLKSSFYSFESLAETKNISLIFQSESNNISAAFDPDKMEKIVCNLFSNAIKFTAEKGEVNVSVKLLGFSNIEIRIKDTGIGIPEDRRKHIFDRFYQVDNSLTREHEGTGIGLALTKELVELHKGQISVESTLGVGTEFIIILPLGDVLSDKKTRDNRTEDNFAFEDNLNNSESFTVDQQNDGLDLSTNTKQQEIILIVEDNHDVRSYIREQLEDKYKIIEMGNGEDGLHCAQIEIPDLIITDVMMPKMDGYQFTKKIRSDEKTSHIPIIMLTAKAGLNDKIEGLETGIDDYLTKPFSAKELKVRVSNLIYQRVQLRKRFGSVTIIRPSEVTAVSVDQEFLQKVIKTIESHYEDYKFNVEALSINMNMSVSQLNRKLNALVDQPPGQLIRSLRLQRAADLLKQNAGTVAEICYKVGFNDQAYFSRAFKKQFNCSPTDFKKN